MEEAVRGEWCSEAGGNRKWESFRDGLRSSDEKCLGWENCRQPDWFKDNFEDLQKLIMNRNLVMEPATAPTQLQPLQPMETLHPSRLHALSAP